MPFKIPLKKSKGDKVAANKALPVFSKHVEDEMLKGHKAHGHQPHKHLSVVDSDDSNDAGQVTSSQALWIAASNAQAKHNGRERPSSEGSAVEDEYLEEEYYEEEVIEDEFVEEEVVDDLPPRKITIRFDEYDEMQTILHINDYTKHEIHRAWYKRDDYDKMVALARKTAEKVEERAQELGKITKKESRKIEYRGLESWTSMGAAKVRMLKESAIEAVWNEQSRQWDSGLTDADKIRKVYVLVSKGSQASAQDRGFSDELIAKRIKQAEEEAALKKRKRRLLGKSKALLGKSVKVTAGGVVKTAKLGVKTTKLTGKVALATTKAATKTAVATATLDRKMLKEAFIPEKRKREAPKQIMRTPSRANIVEGTEGSAAEGGEDETEHNDETEHSGDEERDDAKKRSKLKLLGVVPIPGTHKTYRADRRQERNEKRIEKQKRRPAWEANVGSGKY